jgi:coproporphyrinogen III oxidase-like Fe-S oxidoreductase
MIPAQDLSTPESPVRPLPLRRVMQLVAPGARARKSKRLLIYVHVPFCSTKCHFCDWVVGYDTADLVHNPDLRAQYVEALCAQIRVYGPRLTELRYRVTNIYWGGGTPTRLTPEQMARVQGELASAFDLSSVIEHTAECSPETMTGAHLETLLRGGLNRVSAGVQSFDDRVLSRMGRAHNAARARDTIALFKSFGLRNFNIDLITGFPDQSGEVVAESVREAVELDVPHISLYMFREFASDLVAVKQVLSGHRAQASRQERASAYLRAKAMLEAAGYEEYVVGYFALKPEFRFDGEHYYFGLMGDYFGFGAGAFSTLGRFSLRSGEASRYGGAEIRSFVDRPTEMFAAPLSALPDQLYLSTYFKAFATPEGIRYARWKDQFGFDFHSFRANRPAIKAWFAEQERAGARFVGTSDGIALSGDTLTSTMMWRQ